MEKEGSTLISYLGEHYGLPGVLLALMLVWIVLQDRARVKSDAAHAAELKQERDARIEDAKAFTKIALELQSSAIDTVNKLSDIFEAMKIYKK